MLRQVIIGTVRDSPKLSPAEREQEFNIRRSLAVEAEFFRRMVAQAEFVFLHTQLFQPFVAETSPVLEPVEIRSRLAEEFQLHLLKLACTERKVPRCDLIAEGLADLPDTERKFLARCPLHIFKVHKNTLSSLRAKVYGILCILRNTLERLEHQVKLTDVSKIVLAAGRTGDIMLLNKVLHLFL